MARYISSSTPGLWVTVGLFLLGTDANPYPWYPLNRDPSTAATEKKRKKKGKRRSQELSVQEGGESDDTTSASALSMGGQYSQDSLDNSVSMAGSVLAPVFITDQILTYQSYRKSNSLLINRKEIYLKKNKNQQILGRRNILMHIQNI